MCGPVVLWDWFVLDFAYLLVLIGGSMVLRARMAMPLTWVAFGALSIAVGGFLFTATYASQVAVAAASTADPMSAITTSNC